VYVDLESTRLALREEQKLAQRERNNNESVPAVDDVASQPHDHTTDVLIEEENNLKRFTHVYATLQNRTGGVVARVSQRTTKNRQKVDDAMQQFMRQGAPVENADNEATQVLCELLVQLVNEEKPATVNTIATRIWERTRHDARTCQTVFAALCHLIALGASESSVADRRLVHTTIGDASRHFANLARADDDADEQARGAAVAFERAFPSNSGNSGKTYHRTAAFVEWFLKSVFKDPLEAGKSGLAMHNPDGGGKTARMHLQPDAHILDAARHMVHVMTYARQFDEETLQRVSRALGSPGAGANAPGTLTRAPGEIPATADGSSLEPLAMSSLMTPAHLVAAARCEQLADHARMLAREAVTSPSPAAKKAAETAKDAASKLASFAAPFIPTPYKSSTTPLTAAVTAFIDQDATPSITRNLPTPPPSNAPTPAILWQAGGPAALGFAADGISPAPGPGDTSVDEPATWHDGPFNHAGLCMFQSAGTNFFANDGASGGIGASQNFLDAPDVPPRDVARNWLADTGPRTPHDLSGVRIQWKDKKMEAVSRGLENVDLGDKKGSAFDPMTNMTWRKRADAMDAMEKELAASQPPELAPVSRDVVACAVRASLNVLHELAPSMGLQSEMDVLDRLSTSLLGTHAANAAIASHEGNALDAGRSLAEQAANGIVAAYLRGGADVAASDGACRYARMMRYSLSATLAMDDERREVAMSSFDAGLFENLERAMDGTEQKHGAASRWATREAAILFANALGASSSKASGSNVLLMDDAIFSPTPAFAAARATEASLAGKHESLLRSVAQCADTSLPEMPSYEPPSKEDGPSSEATSSLRDDVIPSRPERASRERRWRRSFRAGTVQAEQRLLSNVELAYREWLDTYMDGGTIKSIERQTDLFEAIEMFQNELRLDVIAVCDGISAMDDAELVAALSAFAVRRAMRVDDLYGDLGTSFGVPPGSGGMLFAMDGVGRYERNFASWPAYSHAMMRDELDRRVREYLAIHLSNEAVEAISRGDLGVARQYVGDINLFERVMTSGLATEAFEALAGVAPCAATSFTAFKRVVEAEVRHRQVLAQQLASLPEDQVRSMLTSGRISDEAFGCTSAMDVNVRLNVWGAADIGYAMLDTESVGFDNDPYSAGTQPCDFPPYLISMMFDAIGGSTSGDDTMLCSLFTPEAVASGVPGTGISLRRGLQTLPRRPRVPTDELMQYALPRQQLGLVDEGTGRDDDDDDGPSSADNVEDDDGGSTPSVKVGPGAMFDLLNIIRTKAKPRDLSLQARRYHPIYGDDTVTKTSASFGPFRPKEVGAGGAVHVTVGSSNVPDEMTGMRTGPLSYGKVRKTPQDELKEVLEEVYEATLDPRYNRLVLGNNWPLNIWFPEAALHFEGTGGLRMYRLSQQAKEEAMDSLMEKRGAGYATNLTGFTAERFKRLTDEHLEHLMAYDAKATAGMTQEDVEYYEDFKKRLRSGEFSSDDEGLVGSESEKMRVARWMNEEKSMLEKFDWSIEGRRRARAREEEDEYYNEAAEVVLDEEEEEEEDYEEDYEDEE